MLAGLSHCLRTLFLSITHTNTHIHTQVNTACLKCVMPEINDWLHPYFIIHIPSLAVILFLILLSTVSQLGSTAHPLKFHSFILLHILLSALSFLPPSFLCPFQSSFSLYSFLFLWSWMAVFIFVKWTWSLRVFHTSGHGVPISLTEQVWAGFEMFFDIIFSCVWSPNWQRFFFFSDLSRSNHAAS